MGAQGIPGRLRQRNNEAKKLREERIEFVASLELQHVPKREVTRRTIEKFHCAPSAVTGYRKTVHERWLKEKNQADVRIVKDQDLRALDELERAAIENFADAQKAATVIRDSILDHVDRYLKTQPDEKTEAGETRVRTPEEIAAAVMPLLKLAKEWEPYHRMMSLWHERREKVLKRRADMLGLDRADEAMEEYVALVRAVADEIKVAPDTLAREVEELREFSKVLPFRKASA